MLQEARARIFAEFGSPRSLTLHQFDRMIPALRAGDGLPNIDEAFLDKLLLFIQTERGR